MHFVKQNEPDKMNAMENTLLNYMNRRFGEPSRKLTPGFRTPGPVITISREVGCGGIALGKMLAQAMNEFHFCKHWQVISKEVLSESANELQLKPEKVNRVFASSERYTFDEILAAFTDKYYKSSRVISKTVGEVIHNFAVDGCCIIVGRAGHLIARDVENGLHVKLVAPMDWRVRQICRRRGISEHAAHKYIDETEAERNIFREHYRKSKYEHEQFDLTIDVSRFEGDKAVSLIVRAFELTGMTERIKKEVPYFG